MLDSEPKQRLELYVLLQNSPDVRIEESVITIDISSPRPKQCIHVILISVQ